VATFKKQQERLWKTVDRYKDEYRKYLKTLSRDELVEEILEVAADRAYAAFTTDLVMNVFLEQELITEKEANTLPIEFLRKEIDLLKKRRAKKRSKK
jgi:hypothetical protein